MSWWKRGRCQACNTKFKKGEHKAELRLQTGEGLTTLEVCQRCADILDASADILRQKKRRKDEE